jgi:hypothetical protein
LCGKKTAVANGGDGGGGPESKAETLKYRKLKAEKTGVTDHPVHSIRRNACVYL